MKQILVIFLVLVSATSMAQSKEEKIWSRVNDLNKAVFETKDSLVLDDIVSAGVTYGHSGGNLEDKKTMISKAVASKTTYKNIEFERLSLDRHRKTAVLRHNFRATSMENGTESPLNLSIIQVWKKQSGKWILWARQAVRIQPK
ncbi:MAG: nuclear transport factor 2 family protein [Flavisolibacter sp.]